MFLRESLPLNGWPYAARPRLALSQGDETPSPSPYSTLVDTKRTGLHTSAEGKNAYAPLYIRVNSVLTQDLKNVLGMECEVNGELLLLWLIDGMSNC